MEATGKLHTLTIYYSSAATHSDVRRGLLNLINKVKGRNSPESYYPPLFITETAVLACLF